MLLALLLVASAWKDPEIDWESQKSRHRSHSAGGRAQSNEQCHTAICCSLLAFFWLLWPTCPFLTAVWCTFRYFLTFLAGSETGKTPG
jgi:hypothetical protein